MPVLDRQPVRERAPMPSAGAVVSGSAAAATAGSASTLPPSLQGLPPRSVPETAPTPLQKHYVLLCAPALIAGAIAITALEAGVPASSLLVKLCALVAAPLLFVTTVDATVRIWRSAWAWMPVDRSRGLFRLAWVVVSLVFLAVIVVATLLVLGA